eukprot:INCI8276.3.p1 GENE.INCI8276.3~~INCI8276.3.p1  ORF type:complete len:1005 (+),score=141.56 INCI8276.3:126-3140(+)
MGTGASVPSSSSHGGDVLDESQAQRLAGPIWHQATFNQYAKDHELESGGVVRGIKRNEYMAVVWDAMAGNLGIDQRKGPFWERVHRLYLFMDGALGGTDGKVTLEELKAFFGGDSDASAQATYYLEQIDAYSKNQGFITLDEVYGYFDYLGGPEAEASIQMLESFEAWEGYTPNTSSDAPISTSNRTSKLKIRTRLRSRSSSAAVAAAAAEAKARSPKDNITLTRFQHSADVQRVLDLTSQIIAGFSAPGKENEVWKDPSFLPDRSSLAPDWAAFEAASSGGGKGDQRKSYKWATATWHPARHFMGDQYLHATTWHKADPHDVQQGLLNDCYFLSALSTISEIQHELKYVRKIFIRDSLEAGVFVVQFCIGGEFKPMCLDSFFPCDKNTGLPIFSHAVDETALWVLLLEKAWAKVHGSYFHIDGGGSPGDAMRALTGAPSQSLHFQNLRHSNVTFKRAPSIGPSGVGRLADLHEGTGDDADSHVFRQLLQGTQIGHLICASVPETDITAQSCGLVTGHSYALLDAVEIQPGDMGWDGPTPLRLVQLRNPWGKFEWKGAWSENSNEWKRYPEIFRRFEEEDLKEGSNTGLFWMAMPDFLSHFEVAHINCATPEGHYHHTNVALSAGEHLKGVSQRTQGQVESIGCVRVRVSHADTVHFSASIANQTRHQLRKKKVNAAGSTSSSVHHYDMSMGFIVVDEGFGGGIAVGSTNMEDEGEAELQIACDHDGGSSYLIFISTSPHRKFDGEGLRVVLGAYVHNSATDIEFEEVKLSAEEWAAKQVQAFEVAAGENYGMCNWPKPSEKPKPLTRRVGWGKSAGSNMSTMGIDILEYKNTLASGEPVRLKAKLELTNMWVMPHAGTMELSVSEASVADASRPPGRDNAAINVFNLSMVIEPGQSAVILMRQIEDAFTKMHIEASYGIAPKQLSEDELLQKVRFLNGLRLLRWRHFGWPVLLRLLGLRTVNCGTDEQGACWRETCVVQVKRRGDSWSCSLRGGRGRCHHMGI